MTDVKKYREGYEAKLHEDHERRDEVFAKSFVLGFIRVPVDELKSYVRNEDKQQGRDDAAVGKPFNPGGDDGNDDSGGGGGCFITTACTSHAGLPDDCHELQTLRAFRDTYVTAVPGGPEMIADYYRTAPATVSAIEASANRDAVLGRLFQVITSAVRAIEGGRQAEALEIYSRLVAELREDFG